MRAVAAPVIGAVVTASAGVGPLPGALVGGVFSALLYVMRQTGLELKERRADAEEQGRSRREMRRIAELARELLLETSIWTDVDELASWVQAQQFSEREVPAPREWTVAAIAARGRADLDAAEVRGWLTMAQLLRDHAQRLPSTIDQEFPGQPAERRSELREVFRAVEAAAKAADAVAPARERVLAAHWGTSEEKRVAEDALSAATAEFYGACAWIEGTVMRIEPDAELLAAIESSHVEHRTRAEAAAAARRELQTTAARTAGQLLRDAAPAEPYLERSTLGRAGTLLDIAADEQFAFARDDEVMALFGWRARIATAQRRFGSAVEGRGLEMSRTTHWLWVQVHGDGIREFDNAVEQLREDLVRAGTFAAPTDFVLDRVERSRQELRGSVRRLVEKIGRLQGHKAP